MKKKIILLICMLAAILSFTACAGKESDKETYDQAQLEQVAEFMLSYCAGADEATFEEWYNTSEFGVELQLTQAGLPVEGENFLGVMKAWQAGVEECGSYIGHGDYNYEVKSNTIEVTADAEFENRDAEIIFVFDKESNLESMTVSAKMTTGEILKKAGLNTILGMGTVFSVLILIAFIISLFKYIPKIQEMFAKKPEKTEKTEEPITETAPAAAAPADDSELIAVIAAAIAAAEGTSTDGFVVRSIRRRPANKWNSK